MGNAYEGARKPAPIIEAACWSHARRKFYELATLRKAPIAMEAVRRMDELFAIEREIIGLTAAACLAVRQERSRPLAQDLETWLREERARLSSKKPRRQGHPLQPETLGGHDPLPR
jgi:transposase